MLDDIYLQTEYAMEPAQRQAFLERLNTLNPHMRGAQVADYLAILHDQDAALDFVEPTFDELHKQVDEGDRTLIGPCALAVFYSAAKPTIADVRALITKAKDIG